MTAAPRSRKELACRPAQAGSAGFSSGSGARPYIVAASAGAGRVRRRDGEIGHRLDHGGAGHDRRPRPDVGGKPTGNREHRRNSTPAGRDQRPAAADASRSRRARSASSRPASSCQAQLPVGPAGDVHPRLAAEPEQVLRRHDRDVRLRGEREPDQEPARLVARGSRPRRRPATRGGGCGRRLLPPAERGVVVVRARVDDASSRRRAIGLSCQSRSELQSRPSREPELVAEPLDRRRDHAEVLGDQRQRRRARADDGVEELAAGPAAPACRRAPSCAPSGTAQ